MKVAVYVRVACADQLSLEHQTERVKDYAGRCGHTTVSVVADNGVSGFDNCEGLAAIMRLASEGQIDAVLCSEPSRISRDVSLLFAIQNALRKQGVSIQYLPGCAHNIADLENLHLALQSYI